MRIKTTINIKKSLFVKICNIASQYDLKKSFIVNYLMQKTMKHFSEKARLLQTVQYQARLFDENDSWHCMAVSFLPDVYEKSTDLRKLAKLSVSLFVAQAFDKYLNELIHELNNGEKGDNYSPDYLVFQTKLGYLNHITIIWGKMEAEKLAKIKEIHTE